MSRDGIGLGGRGRHEDRTLAAELARVLSSLKETGARIEPAEVPAPGEAWTSWHDWAAGLATAHPAGRPLTSHIAGPAEPKSGAPTDAPSSGTLTAAAAPLVPGAPTENVAVEGVWDAQFAWPIIGIHATLTPDNKVLTFGTDEQGMQSGQWVYDVWDPATGTHYTLENTTPTDLFCGVAMIVPETGEVLISGGDARAIGSSNDGVNDVNVFDYQTMGLSPSPLGDMAYQRWYPTMVTLPTGQLVIMGGIDGNGDGVGTPEIYTPGDGWRELAGAHNVDQAQNWYYPRAWVMDDGTILYLAADWSNNPVDIYSLDPAGEGTVTKIGELPFSTTYLVPSIRYAPDKILMMSAGGELWSMDVGGATLSFTQIAPGVDLPLRKWANMAVLADGRVVISGGSAVDSAAVTNEVVDAVDTVLIFDPATNQITVGDEAATARLYHSTTLLLPDATLLSLGGGAPGPLTNLNGEVYRPDYLYNPDGSLAERPVIGDVTDIQSPGSSFTLTVDDSADISRLTLVQYGTVTHSTAMASNFTALDFTVIDATTLQVTLPASGGFLVPGYWMLFAFDNNGTPSVSSQVRIAPSADYHEGPAVVTVYSGDDFTGASQDLSVAIYEAAKGELGGIGDNALSSFTIAEGYELLLSTEENPGPGDTVLFTGSVASLPTTLDDSVSWIRVRKVNALDDNTAPRAIDDRLFAEAGQTTILRPLANDLDLEGDSLRLFQINGAPVGPGDRYYFDSGGRVIVNADYSLTFDQYYTHAGELTFTYAVTDQVTAFGQATVTLVMDHAAGAAPVANNDAYHVNAGSAAVLALLANDADPGGNGLQLTEINGAPVSAGDEVMIPGGKLAVNADGTVTFVPAHGYTGEAGFTYAIASSTGVASADALLVVSTPLHNRPPSIQDDSFQGGQGDTVAIDVLANDEDYEGDALIVSKVNGTDVVIGSAVAVANGAVNVGAGYALQFVPEPGWFGETSFTYTGLDPAGRAGVATVSGTIAPVATTGAIVVQSPSVPGDPIDIRVEDDDRAGAGTVDVTVSNNRTGEAETLALTETGAGTGVFAGAMPTVETGSAGAGNDGTLHVALGDGVTVVYQDALAAQGAPLAVTAAIAANLIEDDGGNPLQLDGSGGYRIIDGGASIDLEGHGKVNVGPASFPGWTALHAEANGAGGYAVLWQHATGRYTVWQTDVAGTRLSQQDHAAGEEYRFEPQFAADIDGNGLLGELPVESEGVQELRIDAGGGYRIIDGGASIDLEGHGKVNVGPASFPGWTALHAEANGAGGYAVLWQHATGRYTVWQTDAAGTRLSQQDYAAGEEYRFEPQLAADIDGNGLLGELLVEADGTQQLRVDSTNGYRIIDGGASIDLEGHGKTNVGPNTFPGWTALHAEANGSGGYAVLWQHSVGHYTVWQTDAAGTRLSQQDYAAGEEYRFEPQFAADLDGNGLLGQLLVEADGTQQLLVDSTNGYRIVDGGASIDLEGHGKVNVGPNTFPGWTALHAEANGAGGYAVLWQHTAGHYTVWQTDAAGMRLSQQDYATADDLVGLETMFAADLNSDGEIGLDPLG